MEFSSCGSLLSFKFNMDDLCDDFVLISMLIGNDFLPHLPNFHVTSNIMSILFDAYKLVLLKLDGYINEHGRLNVQRFNVFLDELKKSDFTIYKNHENVMRIKKTAQNGLIATNQNGNGSNDDVEENEVMFTQWNSANHSFIWYNLTFSQTDADRFPQVKIDYYKEKDVHFTEKGVRNHAMDYVSTVQWVLSYYYTSNYSWNWYYPCNYAPFVSDFPDLNGWKIEFANDEPAMPLEHLLAVQPVESSHLLPPPIRALMRNDLKHFFPPEISLDSDGKFACWETLPLLPFVEKDVFNEAVDAVIDQLNEEESKRNVHKPMVQYECLEYEDDVLVDRIELPFERFAQNPSRRINRMATIDASVVNFSDLKYLPYSVNNFFFKSGRQQLSEHCKISDSSGEIVDSTSSRALDHRIHSIGRGDSGIGNHRQRIVEYSRFDRVASRASSSSRVGELVDKENLLEWRNTSGKGDFRNWTTRWIRTACFHYSRAVSSSGIMSNTTTDFPIKLILFFRANVQGIRLGQVDVVAHVMLVQYEKLVPDVQTKEFVAERIYDGDFLMPVAGQTIVKDCIFSNNRSRLCARGQIKLGALVFLMGNRMYHGQRAYVMAKNMLDSSGRVASKYFAYDFSSKFPC